MHNYTVDLKIILLSGVLAVCSHSNVSADIDYTPQVSLREILPEDFVKSPSFRINVVGINRSYYQFKVETELGNFRVDSIALLLKRLKETSTVIQISNQLQVEVDPYADGLGSELVIQGDSAVDLLTSPLSAASNFADQLATNLGETIDGEGSINDYRQAAVTSQNTDPIIDMHKRNIASQLSLDVYSRNYHVQKFLNRLAVMRAGGNISAGARLVQTLDDDEYNVQSGAIDRKISALVRASDAKQLSLDNEARLSNLKVPGSLRKTFLSNENFNPWLQTAVISYLEALQSTRGLYEVIRVAALIDEPIAAMSLFQLIKMQAKYHETVAPLRIISSSGNIISAETEDGRLLHFYSQDLLDMEDDESRFIDRVVHKAGLNDKKRSEIVVYADIPGDIRSLLLQKNIDYREFFLRQ